MKKSVLFLFPALIVFAMVSCKEEPPAINLQPESKVEDTTYITSVIPAAQQKEILLEDISGVKCVNCPDAAAIALTLTNTYPGRINVVTIQPKIDGLESLTRPIDENGVKTKNDMRTEAAANICTLVGIPNSLPSGYVNRKTANGKTDAILSRDEWTSMVQSELVDSTPVNIELTAEYNRATEEMEVSAVITFTKAVTGNHYLSIAIVEDSIVDAQERKQGLDVIFDPSYLHRHTMRDMLTSHTGDLLNTSAGITLVPGRVFRKVYRKKVTPYTSPEHFSVTAYVHEDATSKYVVHSQETEVELK
jgi:hypothetical protein